MDRAVISQRSATEGRDATSASVSLEDSSDAISIGNSVAEM